MRSALLGSLPIYLAGCRHATRRTLCNWHGRAEGNRHRKLLLTLSLAGRGPTCGKLEHRRNVEIELSNRHERARTRLPTALRPIALLWSHRNALCAAPGG